MGFVGARSRGRVVASCLALSGVLLLGSGCGPVMGYFELRSRERMRQQQIAAHQAALDPEREACRDEIAALQGEDRQLQLRSENLLEQLAGEFREQLGSSSFGGNRKERDSQLACLDRKA